MEKIYSEITKKFYLTKEAKELEEKAFKDMMSEKEAKEKQLAEEKAKRLAEINDQRVKMNAEIDKYNELVNKFNKDYSRYHQTIVSTNMRRPEDIFDLLVNGFFGF